MRRWMWTLGLGLTALAASVWAPRDIVRGQVVPHPPGPPAAVFVPTIPELAPLPAASPAQEVPDTFWLDAVDCGMG